MKVLIVRHAQSQNNIVQADSHIMMSRGELTPEAAQVFGPKSRFHFEAVCFSDLSYFGSLDGCPGVLTTRGYQKLDKNSVEDLQNTSRSLKRIVLSDKIKGGER